MCGYFLFEPYSLLSIIDKIIYVFVCNFFGHIIHRIILATIKMVHYVNGIRKKTLDKVPDKNVSKRCHWKITLIYKYLNKCTYCNIDTLKKSITF